MVADKGFKLLLLLLGALLIAILWRGVPVQLQITGPMSSPGGIPISLYTSNDPGRYDLQATQDGTGTLYITRLDKISGTIEVFQLDRGHGKLVPVDRK